MPPRIIDVPKTDRDAYRPSRMAGALLRAQATHIREALTKHLQELKTLVEVELTSLKTEADVSNYIHKATAFLHTYHPRPKDK